MHQLIRTSTPPPPCSGSDDGSVRLWSVHDSGSVARIQAPANVCSVQFSPSDAHTVAFGCANYRVYLYDLRHTAAPLAVAAGPQRAVSYVRFLGGSHLVSASTDSTLRCGAGGQGGGLAGGWAGVVGRWMAQQAGGNAITLQQLWQVKPL